MRQVTRRMRELNLSSAGHNYSSVCLSAEQTWSGHDMLSWERGEGRYDGSLFLFKRRSDNQENQSRVLYFPFVHLLYTVQSPAVRPHQTSWF